jgi:hypothetical protein
MKTETWNHRVMNCPSENGGDDLLVFKEVHYTNGVAHSYGNAFLCGEDRNEMVELATRLLEACSKQVMHENQFNVGEKK